MLAEALFENLPLTDKATYLKASAFEELLGEDFAETFTIFSSWVLQDTLFIGRKSSPRTAPRRPVSASSWKVRMASINAELSSS